MSENGFRVKPVRSRAKEIDRHIGQKVRDRRIALGLSQQQLADMIGVTYQQAHKYEKGVNRLAAARLYSIAQCLNVEIGYFFEGLEQKDAADPTPQQRMLLELARSFVAVPSRQQQEAICAMTRALASEDKHDKARAGR